jgi:paraquat-inducible protein B
MADELGGLGAGTPIYYRDVLVGEVMSVELLTEPQAVRIRIFVRDPYDQHVVAATRFWKTSGVSLQALFEV